MDNEIRLRPGDLIQYSNDLATQPECRVWETGFVIGPKPGREHMFIVYWYSDNNITVEHERTQGCEYRMMPR